MYDAGPAGGPGGRGFRGPLWVRSSLPQGRLAADLRTLRRGLTVSRADVAHLMLAVLTRPETIGQTIGIAN